ncbi:MAG: type II toxin-antitoxin system RelB/DinJ family antitoxin [Kistimonas sp.]|nr:type II toxin-antitoxin system RelB/DinJ family antitoxin [Kistimonas sp.]
MGNDSVVRARIDSRTKERATAALEAMGLSVSDAIRLLLLRVADEKRLPFAVQVPNAKTVAAVDELDAGRGERFSDADALLKDGESDFSDADASQDNRVQERREADEKAPEGYGKASRIAHPSC